MQFQGKHIIQTHESDKKTHFAPDLIWSASSFFKNLLTSVTRDHNQLSSCTISEKNIDPIFRKISDEQTDGRTDRQTEDRQTDGQEPFHRTLLDKHRSSNNK